MDEIGKNSQKDFLEKIYELQGLDLKLYQLKIKFQKDTFIFETKKKDIIYKKKLSLNDFNQMNEFYSSFTNPTIFFKQHLCKLNNKEIEIKSGKKVIKIWLIPELKNSVIKKEIVLEPQEMEKKNENILENDNEIFKIDIIKKYPNKIDKFSEKPFIINIIKKNSEVYFRDNQEFIKNFTVEELNKIIDSQDFLMEIIIISFQLVLKFYKIDNINIKEYETEFISIYEFISNGANTKENDNLTFFFCYGKIFEKNKDNNIILNEFNKIIFVNDGEHIIGKEYENQFIFLSFLQLKNSDENHIYYQTTKLTKIHLPNINEEINSKILIKLNLMDYNDTNIFNRINIKCTNEIIKIINSKIIYISFYEPKYSQEYYPQKMQLLSDNISYNFIALIIKGYCNEINLFLNIYGGFAYEYYFISKNKDFLPTSFEVNINDGKKYKSNELWSYEISNRKKITFMNIPKQSGIEEKVNNKNNFLKIYVYENSENEKKEYGTFLLDNLKIQQKQEIKINNEFNIFSEDIIDDVKQIFEDKSKISFLFKKYFVNHNTKFDNELKEDYSLYYFPNNEDLFYYFNRLCIWNILLKEKVKNWYYLLSNYFELFEEINDSDLNFSEKIILLITITRRALESEFHLFPKIKFFDRDCIDNDAYTKAFYFHLDLLDSLKEDSQLMLPILQLNSYIMDKILTDEEKNLIKTEKIKNEDNSNNIEEKNKELKNEIDKQNFQFTSAYTISMLPINIIKKNIKKTMLPYCLLYGFFSKKDFMVSRYKDNNIICFNEEQIVGDSYFLRRKNNYISKFYLTENIGNYSFVINLLFLHINFFYNKNKLLNIVSDSPIMHLDKFYKNSIFVRQNYIEEKEYSYLLESIKEQRKIIQDLINLDNNLGELLNVEYFNQDNFDQLHEKLFILFNDKNNYSILLKYFPFGDKIIDLDSEIYLRKKQMNSDEKYRYLMEQAKKTFSDY